MTFKKKIKLRVGLAVGYAVLGALMIVLSFFIADEDAYLSSFGLILAVMGLVRCKQYLPLLTDQERLRRREIAETDERSVMIVNRARSLTLTVFTTLCCLTVTALSVLGLREIALTLAAAVFVLTVIYLILYGILSKRY